MARLERAVCAAAVLLAVPFASGCGERTGVSFQLLLSRDGTAQAAATIFRHDGPGNAPSSGADPETDLPPPDWLDDQALVRMSGIPMPRVSDAGFGATWSGFEPDVPISFEVLDGAEIVLTTAPLQLAPASVIGPPPGVERSASEDLTFTFDGPVPPEQHTFLLEPISGVVAFELTGRADASESVLPATALARFRDEAIAAGAPSGPEGFEARVISRGFLGTSEHAEGSHAIESCFVFVTLELDDRPLVILP